VTDRAETFEVGDDARVVVKLAAGTLRLITGTEGEIEVAVRGKRAADLRIEKQGDTITIATERGGILGMSSSFDVTVAGSSGLHVEAKLGSANLIAEVPLGSLHAGVASGNIRVGDIRGAARLKTASGDVEISECEGDLRCAAASGDLHVGCGRGATELTTASGDADIGVAEGRVVAKTAAGDVRIRCFDGDALQAKTLSGDVRVGIRAGSELGVDLQTLSGDVRHVFDSDDSEPVSHRASLRIKTLSGDIVLERSRY